MKILDYAKVNTRPKTMLLDALDATIGALLLFAFLTLSAGILLVL